jgi:hypothetical protein
MPIDHYKGFLSDNFTEAITFTEVANFTNSEAQLRLGGKLQAQARLLVISSQARTSSGLKLGVLELLCIITYSSVN